MIKSIGICLMAFIGVLAIGCSREEVESKQAEIQEHAWQAQVEALEKAKELDKMLQNSAARQRQEIDGAISDTEGTCAASAEPAAMNKASIPC